MRVTFTTNLQGRCEATLTKESDWRLFDKVAKKIAKKFDGKIIARLDGLDQRYWDIEINGQVLTLHQEHYLVICLFSQDENADSLVKVVGHSLESVVN